MQELIARAKELLADGTVVRVLGWKAGDLPYNPEAAYFETAESLDEFVYNGFCGQSSFRSLMTYSITLIGTSCPSSLVALHIIFSP